MIRAAFLLPLALAGCVGTVTTVAKAPFRVAGRAVDLATVSPSERDAHYTRRMRKQQEREDKARREAAKRCRKTPDAAECGAANPT